MPRSPRRPRPNPIKQADRSYMLDEWRPGLYYHLIGKAVPGRTLFVDEEDHVFFLKHVLRFKWYTLFQIFGYCLCGNHFHVVVRTRAAADILAQLRRRPGHSLSPADQKFVRGELPYARYLEIAYAGPLSGFARHINAAHRRRGQVLINPSLHGLTDKGAPGVEFSRRLLCYVVLNHVKHGIAGFAEAYRWSSLHSEQFGIVDRAALYAHFGGEAAFEEALRTYLERYGAAFRDFDEARFYRSLQPRRFREETGRWVDEEWRDEPARSAGA